MAKQNLDKTLYDIECAVQKCNEELTELDYIYQVCEQYNIEPELALAMIKVESNFNQYAVSNAGCSGYMQISPIHNVANVFGLRENIGFGTSYISDLIINSDTLDEALTKYNRGTYGYYKYLAKYGTDVSTYSKTIIDYMNQLSGLVDE